MVWKGDSDPEEVAVVIGFWDMTCMAREVRAEERSVMCVERMICKRLRAQGRCTLPLQAGLVDAGGCR